MRSLIALLALVAVAHADLTKAPLALRANEPKPLRVLATGNHSQTLLDEAAPILYGYEASNSTPMIALASAARLQGKRDISKWMSYMDDKTPITMLNLPGAHDAATKGDCCLIVHVDFSVTQSRSIIDLLNLGVRVLDIRVGYFKDRLVIFHGDYPITPGTTLFSKGIGLQGVIEGIAQWLDSHPSESVQIHLKVDYWTAKNSDRRFTDVVYSQIVRDIVHRKKAYFHLNDWRHGAPTLGQLRKKIQVLQRTPIIVDASLPYLGPVIDWHDNTASDTRHMAHAPLHTIVQDVYSLHIRYWKATSAAKDKWIIAQKFLRNALAHSAADKMYISFTSAVQSRYPFIFPDFYANEVNPLFNSWLKTKEAKEKGVLGTVMIDFVHTPSDLISNIIEAGGVKYAH